MAEYISDVEGFLGDARLFKLASPVKWRADKPHTFHVIVSRVDAMFSGWETLIFPADADGNILEWGDLPGSARGNVSHLEAITDLETHLQEMKEN